MEAADAGAGRSSEPPLAERVARRAGKRPRKPLQLFDSPLIKDEEQESEAADGTSPGAGPVVPSAESPPSPAAATESVLVAKSMLRCSLCSHTLKKPIYQCAAGHLACCGCRVKLPDNACRKCGTARAAALCHSPWLDAFFGKVEVPCPFARYGCRSFVPYFTSADHRAACAHAPCLCPEPGCGLVCAPRALLAHLAHDHAWPADEARYGTPVQLALPVTPHPHRRLLRGADNESLFLVAAAALGGGGGAAVSVVHVRANRPAHPRFTCTFYANAPPDAAGIGGAYFFATLPVRTTALADGDGTAPEKGLHFAVPGVMLRVRDGEESSRELLLSVRIDRSFGPETSGDLDTTIAEHHFTKQQD
ncbi:hypothetical protein QOZ80_1AG0007800 [Eleusine coracana subsp. coracana]|nr:hypothetical protein QOZ80_1AG0007800 [Eleusine coracana subsp. coracana]